MATPFPAAGQWRSSFKTGSLPLFDDIDFVRLRRYVDEQQPGLKISLGEQGLADLREAVDAGEESLLAWQRSEPRVWGRIIRSVYRLLNWKAAVQHLLYALDGADRASLRLLDRGIARWESQNGLSASEAAGLRAKLSANEAQGAVHHLGAHLVLSLAIAVPVPGIRSLARFLWTLAFMVKAQVSRLLRRRGAAQAASIHTPLVAVITLLPIVGGIAYLAARPLRSKLLIRIALDEVAVEMPFGLYRRLRLARWLAPKPNPAADVSAGAAPVR